MKSMNIFAAGVFLLAVSVTGCKTMNKSQKGAVIGAAGGAVVGGVIGKATGNTALGAIIGASVGGVAGAVIGRQMDKQAEEIKSQVPDAEVVRVGEGIVIEFNSKVLFGFDQSSLTSTARQSLDKLAVILKKYPETNIQAQGHTDSRGSLQYNQQLSERRALEAASYLSGYGISPDRILIAASRLSSIGFGESLPKYTNNTAEGQAMNRRVEFLVTANEKMKADAKKDAANN